VLSSFFSSFFLSFCARTAHIWKTTDSPQENFLPVPPTALPSGGLDCHLPTYKARECFISLVPSAPALFQDTHARESGLFLPARPNLTRSPQTDTHARSAALAPSKSATMACDINTLALICAQIFAENELPPVDFLAKAPPVPLVPPVPPVQQHHYRQQQQQEQHQQPCQREGFVRGGATHTSSGSSGSTPLHVFQSAAEDLGSLQTTHMRDTNNVAYSCSVCPKTFTQSGARSR
jgi:hypothetical protein